MIDRLMARLEELATISAEPDKLTRIYLSPEHARANAMVGGWMAEAGLAVTVDAVGNLIGRREGTVPGAPVLMLGSHLDTIRDAGRFDGMLGVLAAIEVADAIGPRAHALEVIGFAEEEGVRFGSTLIGSRAVAGSLPASTLALRDRDGITVAEALIAFGLDPARIGDARRSPPAAYVEMHIEQGPVLEKLGKPLGVVSGIFGATRLTVTLDGEAGHAGTVPMGLRRDALAAAADIILAVEQLAAARPGTVGTVGKIEASPGAANVIAGRCVLSIDMRAGTDPARAELVGAVRIAIDALAHRRGVTTSVTVTHDAPASASAAWLIDALSEAIGDGAPILPSGAGHDAMAMATVCDTGMLFVRCRGGISHNPAESITAADAALATAALLRFVEAFAPAPRT